MSQRARDPQGAASQRRKRSVKRLKTSTKLRLRLAQVELRVMRALSLRYPTEPHGTRFVQCWAVSGRPVTQALDESGQVWERIWRKATATEPETSWWEPLNMERRKKDA